MEIIAQILSIIAMSLVVLAFQCKKNSHVYIYQGLGSVMFFSSFLMFGAMTAAFTNLIVIIRNACFVTVKKKSIYTLILMCLLYTINTILTFNGIFAILIFIASLLETISIWRDDAKLLRLTRLFFVSPVWLANNIYYFSIGGILCEIFAMSSIIISFIRFRKSGFESKA